MHTILSVLPQVSSEVSKKLREGYECMCGGREGYERVWGGGRGMNVCVRGREGYECVCGGREGYE